MKTAKLLLMLMVCGSCFAGCASFQKEKEINVQLFSIRDLIGTAELYAQNHEQVFNAIAEMGYTGIETANFKNGLFYGVTPEEFKADVEAAGLKVISAHTNRSLSEKEFATGDLTEVLAWWDVAIPAHKAAGMQYIVCPSMKIPDNLKDLKLYCEYFNEVGRRCKAAGMEFGFHNHYQEFETVEDTVVLDYMLQNTDPELVFFQMDVFWAVRGKASPVDYFHNYPGRWKLLHIKDNREIGQSGMVGFDAIFNNYEIAGMKDYIVEVGGCRNEKALEGLRVSAEYIKSAPFIKAEY